jgi:hypothetical protein
VKYILAIIGLLWAIPAQAQPNMRLLPPAEYDHPYDGELIVVQKEGATSRCPDNGAFTFKPILGCAFRDIQNNRCLVLLAPAEVIERYGWNTEIVLRHERGHCLGWPAHHPGAR